MESAWMDLKDGFSLWAYLEGLCFFKMSPCLVFLWRRSGFFEMGLLLKRIMRKAADILWFISHRWGYLGACLLYEAVFSEKDGNNGRLSWRGSDSGGLFYYFFRWFVYEGGFMSFANDLFMEGDFCFLSRTCPWRVMDKLVAFCWYASDLVYMSGFFLGEAAVFFWENGK